MEAMKSLLAYPHLCSQRMNCSRTRSTPMILKTNVPTASQRAKLSDVEFRKVSYRREMACTICFPPHYCKKRCKTFGRGEVTEKT